MWVKSDQIAAVKNIRVSSANKAVSGTFTVNDDNAAVLVEPSAVINTLTVTYTDAVPTTAEGKVFYVAIPAQIYHALKIELDADGNGFTTSMTTKASTNIVVDRNKIYPITFAENIPPIPEPDPDAKNLSADGTANCYIVSEYGPYKFDATKKGHTNESVGAIASAEVLWESFGTDVQPEVGDIVKDVAVKNGIVKFTASGKDGNAVIAVFKPLLIVTQTFMPASLYVGGMEVLVELFL